MEDKTRTLYAEDRKRTRCLYWVPKRWSTGHLYWVFAFQCDCKAWWVNWNMASNERRNSRRTIGNSLKEFRLWKRSVPLSCWSWKPPKIGTSRRSEATRKQREEDWFPKKKLIWKLSKVRHSATQLLSTPLFAFFMTSCLLTVFWHPILATRKNASHI